jgi:hypothetical protein
LQDQPEPDPVVFRKVLPGSVSVTVIVGAEQGGVGVTSM